MSAQAREDRIRIAFEDFVQSDPGNRLRPQEGSLRIYDAPLLGFASAADPLFEKFKQPDIIGDIFMGPGEWLPGAKSIVSFYLPNAKAIRDSNRKMVVPSLEWVGARIEGQAFVMAACRFLAGFMESLGGQILIPASDKRFRVAKVVSNWSERHAAFAAGLGTFGLHKGLITKKGTAGRFGSVITTLELVPSTREYESQFEYCPFLMRNKCGACIKRCHVDSITTAGKDKMICSDFLDNVNMPMFSTPEQRRYGCGKCNISVPCEAGIPNIP